MSVLVLVTKPEEAETLVLWGIRFAEVRDAMLSVLCWLAVYVDPSRSQDVKRIMRDAAVEQNSRITPRVFMTEETFRDVAMEADQNDLVLIGVNQQDTVQKLIASTTRPTVAVIKRAPPLRRLWGERAPDWVPRLNPADYADLVMGLRRGSQFSTDFMIMLGLASAIASHGLLQDSPAVVIGSMLLAPLMTPMIGSGWHLHKRTQNCLRLASAPYQCGCDHLGCRRNVSTDGRYDGPRSASIASMGLSSRRDALFDCDSAGCPAGRRVETSDRIWTTTTDRYPLPKSVVAALLEKLDSDEGVELTLNSRSGWLDVFGTRTLWSASFGEGHSLSFSEIVVVDALEAGRVKKQVLLCSGVDKPISLVCDSFNRAFCHLSIPKKGVAQGGPKPMSYTLFRCERNSIEPASERRWWVSEIEHGSDAASVASRASMRESR